eukprot:scaffold8476_cov147-Skeletonema_dohrnii-CCMP3373.AAC.3
MMPLIDSGTGRDANPQQKYRKKLSPDEDRSSSVSTVHDSSVGLTEVAIEPRLKLLGHLPFMSSRFPVIVFKVLVVDVNQEARRVNMECITCKGQFAHPRQLVELPPPKKLPERRQTFFVDDKIRLKAIGIFDL